MHNFIEKMKDNSNGKVVTFDFDGTIMKSFMNRTFQGEENFQFGGVNQKVIDKIKSFKRAGFTVFVVTSRKIHFDAEDYSVENNLRMLEIEVDGIFYTNGNLKAQKLYELGSMMHYDDDPEERKEIEKLKSMYADFNITVRDPEELLQDINEISKGIIITSDYKFVIAQRSDSYEWDAPGGHIQEGEEPVYAFWRETKEELGLELEEIRFLDEQITTWKGEDKKSHYYFGFTPFEEKELEDNIDLQWEVAAYFCGTFQEILNKVNGNATQNLVNVLKLIESQQNMLESYQPHSRNHSTKKKRLIGLGGNKKSGATGMEELGDYKRSKSAPPGMGVLEEENEEKPKKILKLNIISKVQEKKKRKKTKKKKKSSNKGNYYPYWGTFDRDGGSDDGGDGAGAE